MTGCSEWAGLANAGAYKGMIGRDGCRAGIAEVPENKIGLKPGWWRLIVRDQGVAALPPIVQRQHHFRPQGIQGDVAR